MANTDKNPSQSFYEQILSMNDNMSKQASDESAEQLMQNLEDSDLTEEQLTALAGDIDNSMNKDDLQGNMVYGYDVDNMLSKIASELTPEDSEGSEIGNAIMNKFASELCAIAEEGGLDLSNEEDMNGLAKFAADAIVEYFSEDDDAYDDGMDVLASYDEAYDQLTKEGATVADYVYEQIGDEHLAEFIGENAEKLAALSEGALNPLICADDILSTLSNKYDDIESYYQE